MAPQPDKLLEVPPGLGPPSALAIFSRPLGPILAELRRSGACFRRRHLVFDDGLHGGFDDDAGPYPCGWSRLLVPGHPAFLWLHGKRAKGGLELRVGLVLAGLGDVVYGWGLVCLASAGGSFIESTWTWFRCRTLFPEAKLNGCGLCMAAQLEELLEAPPDLGLPGVLAASSPLLGTFLLSLEKLGTASRGGICPGGTNSLVLVYRCLPSMKDFARPLQILVPPVSWQQSLPVSAPLWLSLEDLGPKFGGGPSSRGKIPTSMA